MLVNTNIPVVENLNRFTLKLGQQHYAEKVYLSLSTGKRKKDKFGHFFREFEQLTAEHQRASLLF